MPSVSSCLIGTFVCASIAVSLAIFAAFYVFEIKGSGDLYLDNAPGVVKIVRESDTKILHIFGEGSLSVNYGLGFATAQNRLWQIEKTRRMAKGKLSALFGEKALPVDTFMRQLNLRDLAKESWEQDNISAKDREELHAFADGINDYVQGVSLTDSESQTGRVLPAEFIAFGITQETFEPWTPADTLIIYKLLSFSVTYDWGPTLHREALR